MAPILSTAAAEPSAKEGVFMFADPLLRLLADTDLPPDRAQDLIARLRESVREDAQAWGHVADRARASARRYERQARRLTALAELIVSVLAEVGGARA